MSYPYSRYYYGSPGFTPNYDTPRSSNNNRGQSSFSSFFSKLKNYFSSFIFTDDPENENPNGANQTNNGQNSYCCNDIESLRCSMNDFPSLLIGQNSNNVIRVNANEFSRKSSMSGADGLHQNPQEKAQNQRKINSNQFISNQNMHHKENSRRNNENVSNFRANKQEEEEEINLGVKRKRMKKEEEDIDEFEIPKNKSTSFNNNSFIRNEIPEQNRNLDPFSNEKSLSEIVSKIKSRKREQKAESERRTSEFTYEDKVNFLKENIKKLDEFYEKQFINDKEAKMFEAKERLKHESNFSKLSESQNSLQFKGISPKKYSFVHSFDFSIEGIKKEEPKQLNLGSSLPVGENKSNNLISGIDKKENFFGLSNNSSQLLSNSQLKENKQENQENESKNLKGSLFNLNENKNSSIEENKNIAKSNLFGKKEDSSKKDASPIVSSLFNTENQKEDEKPKENQFSNINFGLKKKQEDVKEDDKNELKNEKKLENKSDNTKSLFGGLGNNIIFNNTEEKKEGIFGNIGNNSDISSLFKNTEEKKEGPFANLVNNKEEKKDGLFSNLENKKGGLFTNDEQKGNEGLFPKEGEKKEEKKEEKSEGLFPFMNDTKSNPLENKKEEQKEKENKAEEKKEFSLFNQIKTPSPNEEKSIFKNTVIETEKNKENDNNKTDLSASDIFNRANFKMKQLDEKKPAEQSMQTPTNNRVQETVEFTRENNPFLNKSNNKKIANIFSSPAIQLTCLNADKKNFLNSPTSRDYNMELDGSKENNKIINQVLGNNSTNNQQGQNNNGGSMQFSGFDSFSNPQNSFGFGFNPNNQQTQNTLGFNQNNNQQSSSLFNNPNQGNNQQNPGIFNQATVGGNTENNIFASNGNINPSSNSIFNQNNQGNTTQNSFGQQSTGVSGIFGIQNNPQAQQTGLFTGNNQGTNSQEVAGGLFGNNNQGGGLFGNNNQGGASGTNNPGTTGGLFGNNNQGGGLFGNNNQGNNQGGLFGNNNQGGTSGSLFSNNQGGLFGNNNQGGVAGSLFGNNQGGSSLFGGMNLNFNPGK